MAERVVLDVDSGRLSANQLVVLQFQPGEPLAVHTRHPHHPGGQVALRIETFEFDSRTNTVEAERGDSVGAFARQATRKPHKWTAPGNAILEIRFIQLQFLSQPGALRSSGRSEQLPRPRV